MTLQAGACLGPYEILAPLGAGGMGEVYRAHDSKLDREVAVKVLPAHLTSDPDALSRFEREAKAVASLSHPNILSIFDFGAQGAVAYAVTELLEGETLRERIHTGPIPQKQAVDWALQIARGLSAAHERGVVHRDLKPDNVFVTRDGHIKILDFGLAKRVDVAVPARDTRAPTASGHTEPGIVMGTLGYMSPEQVKGLPVDPRTDIFSFGTILYEMLSGGRPFSRATASETIAAILKEEPPELTESGRHISPTLAHIVRHCLEKDRGRRFQSARDIEFALEETSSPVISSGTPLAAPASGKTMVLISVATILVLAVGGLVFFRRMQRAPGGAGGVKRVAVLPFENLGSPEDDYFADGIADEIRGKLTSLSGVEVIARGSSTPYKKTTKTPKQIARELDAKYLLTATVRWQKGGGTSRVQVTPELVEVKESGAPASKWEQPFDAALTDVFQVQSDIASRVAQALGVALGAGEEKRLSERPTQNLAAYDAFLKGSDLFDRMGSDPASLRHALTFVDEAVALDPGFAQAWARVALINSLLYSSSTPTAELADRARHAAEKAAALAPDQPAGYQALAAYYNLVAGDQTQAFELFTRAHRLAPGDADAVRGVAIGERTLGRWEAAVEHFQQAERLDPRSVPTKGLLGYTLILLRRYPEAGQVLERGLALAPANLNLIEAKAMILLAQGDQSGARVVLKTVPKEIEPSVLVAYMANFGDLVWVLDEKQREVLLRLTPSAFDDDRGAWGICLAQACALRGDAGCVRIRAAEAREALNEQLRAAPQDAQRHALLGLALAYLGRKEEAIREGQHGAALALASQDATLDPYVRHQLVRIYTLVGEPEKALDVLEPLLKVPYYLTPAWLRIDPNFDPLRKNSRFLKLVAGAK
jgi:TolB-like protein/tetratricopeptide (TPR) repeat protein